MPESEGRYHGHHSSGMAQVSHGAPCSGTREYLTEALKFPYTPKGKFICAFQGTALFSHANLLTKTQEKEGEEQEEDGEEEKEENKEEEREDRGGETSEHLHQQPGDVTE